MKKILYLFSFFCSLLIISCSDNSDTLENTTSLNSDTKVETRSLYDCYTVQCDEGYGISVDLSNWTYDFSDCITPSPSSECSVQGVLEIYRCDNEYVFNEPMDLTLVDCGTNQQTIDWDCIKETIALKLERFFIERLINEENLFSPCIVGDVIYSTQYVKNTCWTSCTTMDPFPQSTLIDCDSGTACCWRRNYWCDNGDSEGLHISDTQTGQYGSCGTPLFDPTQSCLTGKEGGGVPPCQPRSCF